MIHRIESGDLVIVQKIHENFESIEHSIQQSSYIEQDFVLAEEVRGRIRRRGNIVEFFLLSGKLPRRMTDRFKTNYSANFFYEEVDRFVLPVGFRPSSDIQFGFRYSEYWPLKRDRPIFGVPSITPGRPYLIEISHEEDRGPFYNEWESSKIFINKNGSIKWYLKHLSVHPTQTSDTTHELDALIEYCSFVWRTDDPLPN